MDSGAFTLFKGDVTYEGIEKYAYDYAEFLLEMKPYISAAVELDLYEIESVGLRSHEIRERILVPTGVDIIPVYHGDLIPINKQTRQDFCDFCDSSRYVGIASALWKKGASNLAGLVTEAAKRKVMVHGFGITRQDFIRNSRFFTVDSTAWTNGQRFGTHYIFEHNKIRIYSNLYKDRARAKYTEKWRRAGLSLEGLDKDNSETFTRINCWEWVQFQNWCFDQCNRDYWDTYLELNPARVGAPIVRREKVMVNDISYEIDEDFEEDEIEMVETEEEMDELEPVQKPTIAKSWEEFFAMIKEGVEYSFWDRKEKHRRKAYHVPLDDGNWEQTVLEDGEWKKHILFALMDDTVKASQEDRDYNKYLRERFKDKLLTVQESSSLHKQDTLPTGPREELSFVDIGKNQILKCDDCYLSGRCSMSQEGANCTYTKGVKIETPKDLAETLARVIEVQVDRVFKGALIEKLDGGVLDKTISDEMQRTFNMAKMFREIFTEKNEIVIKASGKSGTGILGKMFGDMNKDKE
jgi:hypothetical protein